MPSPTRTHNAARAHASQRGSLALSARFEQLLEGTPYRAIQILGRGGMGEIVEAEHRALGKRVVVKLLHDHHQADEQLVHRLQIEAQALARLSHENLVAVHDLGRTATGRPYYVMDRLIGRTLREELACRGALPVAEALALSRQALAGLSVAHAAGLVHRDVKLDNLFVCEPEGGRQILKVIDFGVAKVLDGRYREASDSASTAPQLTTREGLVLGTPRFLSPEQARGALVDARSDVYSMGVVLYVLLAGRGPFDHLPDTTALVRAHAVEHPDSPSRHAPRPLPAALERAVAKALAKQPEERFQSALAFSEALLRIERDLDAIPAKGRDHLASLMTQPLRPEAPVTAPLATALLPEGGSPISPLPWSLPRTEPAALATVPFPARAPVSASAPVLNDVTGRIVDLRAFFPPRDAALPPLQTVAPWMGGSGIRDPLPPAWNASQRAREPLPARLMVGLTLVIFGIVAAILVRWWMA